MADSRDRCAQMQAASAPRAAAARAAAPHKSSSHVPPFPALLRCCIAAAVRSSPNSVALAMSHMSPVAGAGTPGGGSINWTQHVSPDGRPYWNNVKTGQSVWEKPSELKTPAEREIEKTPWKEYETGGRKYWVHSETKETTWEAPAVVKGEQPLCPARCTQLTVVSAQRLWTAS